MSLIAVRKRAAIASSAPRGALGLSTTAIRPRLGSRTAPAGSRLVIANRAIHTGDIFGIPSKTVMSLASLMLALQVVSGVAMWWKRERKKRAAPDTAGQTVA